jgi:GxxExxY protein
MTPKRPDRLLEGEITSRIIGAFYECYNQLGFGFLESVYRRALATELRARGLDVQEEAPLEVVYKGVVVGLFRLDLLVEHRVVTEIKASSLLSPTDRRQLLNYLRATRCEVGLLLYFGPEPNFFRLVSQNRLRPARKNIAPGGGNPAGPAASV